MKLVQFNICSCVLMLLLLICIGGSEARLLLGNRGGIFCFWGNKRTCDKTTPVCIQVAAITSCKNYANQCKYLIDQCFGKTVYGRTGVVAAATSCATIPVGGVGTC